MILSSQHSTILFPKKKKRVNKSLCYSDVCLVPNYSRCFSRSDCDTSVNLFGRKFELPIVPANMKSVINMNLAKWMSEKDYFYIMHRFDNSLKDIVSSMNDENWKTISVSSGVKLKDKSDILQLSKSKQRIDFITIDIAHGHCERMKTMISHIKKLFPSVKVIAGNVATPSAVRDLASWGADMVKVGIGQGSPCTTKDKTGFTMPMFSCTLNCSGIYANEFEAHEFLDKEPPVPIIADGGIKCNGDIAKALVAGADMVMAGGLFASCTDSPASVIDINGVNHKAYFGSASFENKGHNNHIEGKLNKIPTSSLSLKEKLSEIKQDVQSALSYAGGENLSAFQNVEYIEQ